MDPLVEKLKLLNCQQEVWKKLSLKPLSNWYFTETAQNPNEQFYRLVVLLTWLSNQIVNVRTTSFPGQFDDPNVVTQQLFALLKQIPGKGQAAQFQLPAELTVSRLRQPYGDMIVQLVQDLVDLVLAGRQVQLKAPQHNSHEYDQAEVDTLAEQPTEAVQKFMDDEDDEVDAENQIIKGDDAIEEEVPQSALMPDSTLASPMKSNPSHQPQSASITSAQAQLEKRKQEAEQWRAEVERVTPMLKVLVVDDHKDWRLHLQQMESYHQTIKQLADDLRPKLDRMTRDVESQLEKISSREKYMNSQFADLCEEYKSLQEKWNFTRQQHSETNGRVIELSNELSRINDDLEAVQSQMDDLGSGMTDPKPLVQLRQALGRLQTEVKDMDVRSGIVRSILASSKPPAVSNFVKV